MRQPSLRAVLALAIVAATASGCGAATPSIRSHHPGAPTEGEARDAYFNTPLIPDDNARQLPLGVTLQAVIDKFSGAAAIRYRRAGRSCVLYPIEETERWDAYGSPVASEWEFCFLRDKLVAKRRIP